MTATKPAASRKKPTTARKKTTPRRKPAAKPNSNEQVTITLAPTPETQQINFPSVQIFEQPEYTMAQKQAKLEAYDTLKRAGLAVPQELSFEVEGWIAEAQESREAARSVAEGQAAQESKQVAKANIDGPWYVRNCYNAPFNLRLDRQTEKRRIELKGRGFPGDMHPLKDEDLKDSILITNVKLGLLEVIPAGEAQLIVEKQTTNMSVRQHTPLAVIQKEYSDHANLHGMNVNPNPQFKVEAEFNSQGVTVATIDPRLQQGQMLDREVAGARSWGGLQRGQGEPQFTHSHPTIHSGFVPTGGNPAIVSQGGMMGDNARAKAVDDLARRKGGQGPQAGLGDVTVTVAPVQRT